MLKLESQRDFKIWLDFFEQEKGSLTKFIYLLNKKDTYFVNHPLQMDFDNEFYEKVRPGGFIEKDFQEILYNSNPKDVYYKTRLAIAISYNLDFELIKERLGQENFVQVLEKTLIDGHYEKYEIKFENLISNLISKSYLPKQSLVDVSFLRGVNLGSRQEEEKELKKIIMINKIKSKLGF